MLDDLYSDALLEAAGSVPAARTLPDADATARRSSKVCGSSVELDLSVRDGVVADVALRVKACALGQASAGIFARTAEGATPAELHEAAAQMRAMLKEDGPPPSNPRFAEAAKLQPIKAYPARHASTLLVWDAAVDCLDQIAARA
ncbi:iron-sulfur cluster assembly scaffold protein [Parvularcula dongshanensis]|uniref:NifU-like protein involved in Fe-S cluster formation n=1 Tax=Parvularcula dongshanensis TaxID=1173995 RepID=A0A840I0D6_9PROT|nr:iron-sulfur cluster assembly scaffold protein [Parvularcula dongshanensis]MBB4657805.1 NifU-like protein involved in Fe-S cluster formation [Parvularcula dongshanensis]